MQLVLQDDDSEDSYGAAAMIQDVYPAELKVYLLDLMCQKIRFRDRKKLKKLNQLFRLHRGANLTFGIGMSMDKVEKEYEDWKRIAEFFSSK